MRIFYNRFLPFKGFVAINILGVIFARHGAKIDIVTENHERIHTAQMRELLYIGFYLLYFVEWLVRLIMYRNFAKAYDRISFEREAYDQEFNLAYTSMRSKFASFKCLLNGD